MFQNYFLIWKEVSHGVGQLMQIFNRIRILVAWKLTYCSEIFALNVCVNSEQPRLQLTILFIHYDFYLFPLFTIFLFENFILFLLNLLPSRSNKK